MNLVIKTEICDNQRTIEKMRIYYSEKADEELDIYHTFSDLISKNYYRSAEFSALLREQNYHWNLYKIYSRLELELRFKERLANL